MRNKSERKEVKLFHDHRADAMDYLDAVLQLNLFLLFSARPMTSTLQANDINPAAETGRITRMAQPKVHLSGGLSFHR